jgi:uncharacterized protein
MLPFTLAIREEARMEKADQEMLLRFAVADTRLKRLYEQHLQLEEEVEKYGRYAPFSSSAALREKELKKEKLRQKDQMMALLEEHKRREGQPLS